VGLGEALTPLHERAFRRLWFGRVASAFGDALVPVALTFAVLSIHESSTAIGVVLAAFFVSRIAFTLAGGVVGDRLSRRTIMLSCDLARGAVEVFTAAMLFTGHMTIPLFVLTGAIFGTASGFFGPASNGLVPLTISSENLQSANALLALSRNAMNVLGPAISGVIVATGGPAYVFAVDAVTFAVSAAFLWRLDVDSPVRGAHKHLATDLREGFHEVRSRAWVRLPLIGFSISNLAFASFLVLAPVMFVDHFHHAKLDWSLVSTFGSLGAIVGALLSARFHPAHPLHAAFIATTLIALPMATVARPLPVPVIAVAWGLAMGSVALGNTWWETTLQRRIPEHLYSRISSYDTLVSFVFMPIGLVSFGWIGDAIGTEWTLFAVAIVAAIANLAVAYSPAVRAVRSETRELGSPKANQVPASGATP
jgi:MFS family permease